MYLRIPEEYWNTHNWSWFLSDDETLTNEYGVNFEMIGIAKTQSIVYYRVELNGKDDELFFLIKTGLEKASFSELKELRRRWSQ